MKNLSEWGSFYWVAPVVILTCIAVRIADGKRWKKSALIGMLTIWFLALIYLLFLYRIPGGRAPAFNIKAFHLYKEAIAFSGPIGKNQALRQIIFNVLLYVPFCVIVMAVNRSRWLSVLIGIVLSVVTEALQYLTGLGWADIDDIISNAIGLIIGTLAYRGITNGGAIDS